MGTWGPGIFSNDVAVDARDDYRRIVGEGRSGPEATDELLGRSKVVAEDDEDGVPFWLGLAATQWRMGRLEPRVRDRALTIIDGGADLERWQDDAPELLAKRRAALAKLRRQLLSPQGPETNLRPPRKFKARFAPGDVISYRVPDGRYTAFRIVGSKRNHEGEFDIAELVDYFRDAPPTVEQASTLPPKPFGYYSTPYIVPLVLNPEAKRRIEVIGRTAPPPPPTYTKRRFFIFPKRFTDWEDEYTYAGRWDMMEHEILPAFGQPDPIDQD